MKVIRYYCFFSAKSGRRTIMEELGDFRILKTLGRGSLGTAYLAEHRFLKKRFVIKVLPKEFTEDQQALKRFERQVSFLSQFDHPNLVKIQNVSTAQGYYFLVTDYQVNEKGESCNLKSYLEERKEALDEKTILSIIRQIAQGLDYLHEQSGDSLFVHGGLKLSNILVQGSEENLNITLSDYGIVQITGFDRIVARSFMEVASFLTKEIKWDASNQRTYPFPFEKGAFSQLSHAFLESYAFLAPEQKIGRPLTRQADSYAFGILTYYLIAKRFPEGLFSFPSSFEQPPSFDFDRVLRDCLQQDPLKRAETLFPLVQEVAKQNVYETRMKEESAQSLKSTLVKASQPFIPVRMEQKVEEKVYQVSSMKVETVSALDAIPTTLNPPLEDDFTQALHLMLNREPVVKQYHPSTQSKQNAHPLYSEMIAIEGGQFMRGSTQGARDEAPQHSIYLKKFAIDIAPVTNEQFVCFLEYMGGEKDEHYHDIIRLKDSRIYRAAGCLSIESGYQHHPVVGVTWYGANAYAKWVGRRLPSEAEWEVAACGGVEAPLFPTGASIEKNQANFFSSDTTAVKSYPPNGYGLYDIVGNVYEWCQDWYDYNYYETSRLEPHQPMGPSQGVYRVLRGGCWKSLREDLRVSHRHRNNPGTVTATYGFRCAADVE